MKEWGEQRQGKMDKSKQVSGHMDTARNEAKIRVRQRVLEKE